MFVPSRVCVRVLIRFQAAVELKQCGKRLAAGCRSRAEFAPFRGIFPQIVWGHIHTRAFRSSVSLSLSNSVGSTTSSGFCCRSVSCLSYQVCVCVCFMLCEVERQHEHDEERRENVRFPNGFVLVFCFAFFSCLLCELGASSIDPRNFA